MSKVTSVEPQKKNSHRFNIFLDGEFAFGADEDLVVDHRLVIGKIIGPEDLEKILLDAEIGKLMERIYGLSNIRQRSEKEIRDFLKRISFKRKIKGIEEISPIVIESTIDRAIKKGLINDEQFAKAWVEARGKKYGPIRIKQELLQKGIDREIIEEVFRQQPTGNSEEVVQKLLEKRLERWKNLDPMHFRKKAYDYLLRRGFRYDLVKSIIENFIKKR